MFAVLLVAILGFQAGAQISSGDAGAFAIVLGSANEPADGTYWSPDRGGAPNKLSKEERLQMGALTVKREPTDPIAFKAKFKADWIRQWKRQARKAGLDHEIQMWDLQQMNFISGPIGFYRLAPGAI
jgi:hypothetical protein